jgi:hypothetical protein
MLRSLTLFGLLALGACTIPGLGDGEDPDATGDGGGNAGDGGEDEYTWEPCEETWVHYVGPDSPVVGDEWTIWLKCDGAILTGPTVIRFEPDLGFALVNENVITWNKTGETTLYVQTGTEKAELDVTVNNE